VCGAAEGKNDGSDDSGAGHAKNLAHPGAGDVGTVRGVQSVGSGWQTDEICRGCNVAGRVRRVGSYTDGHR
jgi:hypothetical protein